MKGAGCFLLCTTTPHPPVHLSPFFVLFCAYGSQSPRWHTVSLSSCYSQPCMVISHTDSESVWPTEYGRGDSVWFFQARLLKTLQLPLWPLGSFTLWESGCHVTRTVKQSCREASVGKNWGLLPTTIISRSIMWVSHFESGSSSLQMTAAPSRHLDYSLVWDPGPKPPR